MVVLGQSDGSGKVERALWRIALQLYEGISRYRHVPLVGSSLFWLMGKLLEILPMQQSREMARPNLPLRIVERIIRLGLCKGFLEEVRDDLTPVLTSFYAPVIAMSGRRKNSVFCQICDSDLSRAWVSANPAEGNIYYFAPCSNAAKRLVYYGVSPDRVYTTGFPFPHELVGGMEERFAKAFYSRRLNLFRSPFKEDTRRPLEVAFVVGGAGAQTDVGIQAAISLMHDIRKDRVKLYLVAGTKGDVANRFLNFKRREFPNTPNIEVLYRPDTDSYFEAFNRLAKHIDVLWTKPSELSFYSALGIPIIITEPLGPQEVCNRQWLLGIGAGADMLYPKYANIWLPKMLYSGDLARMAEQGWRAGLRTAIYTVPQIIDSVCSRKTLISSHCLVSQQHLN